MVEDGCTAGEIPIENVDALTLAKIIKWCNKHHDDDVKGHFLSEEKEKEKEKELTKLGEVELYERQGAARLHCPTSGGHGQRKIAGKDS
ncbi:hypothetical protein Dsin_015773 [Dipteronia sinensis]|uniref:SKP1 component POZ domain-containing protein n=1 Tax=Dipteronia sinensis TaxID=43782 RepID=A0AAE0AD36_9ROSI|nr:hypothetical protein Dsin_015773 [Dipteronia sinensis]